MITTLDKPAAASHDRHQKPSWCSVAKQSPATCTVRCRARLATTGPVVTDLPVGTNWHASAGLPCATHVDRMCSMSAFTSSSLETSVLQKVHAALLLLAPALDSSGLAGLAALPLLLASEVLSAKIAACARTGNGSGWLLRQTPVQLVVLGPSTNCNHRTPPPASPVQLFRLDPL
jgi:hypothetical protein